MQLILLLRHHISEAGHQEKWFTPHLCGQVIKEDATQASVLPSGWDVKVPAPVAYVCTTSV
jgi:hypothetical protein